MPDEARSAAPGVHLGRWVHDSALRAPERPALVVAGDGPPRVLGYGELARRVDHAAAALRDQHGVGPGDRVLVLAQNHPQTVVLFFASAKLGAILVPANWRLAAPELADIVADAAPRVCFVDDACLDLWDRVDAAPAAVELGLGSADPVEPVPLADLPRGGETPVLMLFTSGTTGRPKGALCTHRSIFWNSVNTEVGWDLSGADTTLCHTPLFHTGGWNVLTLPLLRRGGTVVLTRGFDPSFALTAVADLGVTALFAVPTMWRMMLDAAPAGLDLRGLRFAITGGAACPVPLLQAWAARGVLLRQGYGLTEVGPNCFVMPPGEAIERAGTVGFPMPHLETRLVRDDGSVVAGPGDGELQLRGPTVCAGYWDRPEAAAAALRPGGWFATGDLFRRDVDGRFAFAGRRKEMFVSGGENVYPAEVERVLYDLEAVAEAAVVPVEHPVWGEVGHAFVAPAADRSAELDADAVLGACRAALARYKVPKYVTVLDALPKGPSGKIAKLALRDQAGPRG